MDSRMKRELDSYIMGEHLTRTDDVLHRCPQCKGERRIPMVYDMGGWFYKDDDEPFCSNCQVVMNIVEDE